MSVLASSLVLVLAADPRAYAGPEAVPSSPAESAVPEDRLAAPPAAPPAEEPEDRSEAPGPEAPAPAASRPPGPRGLPAGALREVRVIEVTTDLLGGSTRMDVQRHAGGRSIVDVSRAKEQGASGVGEMLDKIPGVRAVEGGSGLGTSATKLNVAVRGADPRLSEQATVMLDEVPIAPAPYGQPALSLFPLSLFQIARVDAVRGGSSVRFGPWTSGGVFNLVSHPIPKNPTISVFAQTDQFGDAGFAGSYGGTHRGLGMYFEYAPRVGRTYRDHSDFQSHGGIVKFAYNFNRRIALESSTHLFWERAQLPGGINQEAYEADRFQSLRPYDFFDGHREATSLKLRWTPKQDHELQVIAFYSHTLRRAVIATNEDRNLSAEPTFLSAQPRLFDVVGVEPRYALRVRHKRGAFHDLSFGARGVFESARLREFRVGFPERPGGPLRGAGDSRVCPTGTDLAPDAPWAIRCLNGRTGGYSLYLEDKLYLLDTRLVLTAGVRFELMQQSFYNVLDRYSVPRPLQGGPLPALSIWYGTDVVAGFLGYGRSFGAPSYYSGTVANTPEDPIGRAGRFLEPELADTVEGGVKLMELGGVYADATGWYKHFNFLRDEGDNTVEIIPGAHAYGFELDVTWEPGEVWEKIEGLELNAGYAWTGSKVLKDLYVGNRMGWYPAHEAWGSLSYQAPFGLKVGTKVDYTGMQYTDYANTLYRATGEIGTMPAYTLMSAFATMRAALPQGWRVEFTLGVKNLLGQEWFTRTDDINGGILAMRPRTFFLNLGFSHEWIRGRAGEQARARPREARPDRRRWVAGERRAARWFRKTWGAFL